MYKVRKVYRFTLADMAALADVTESYIGKIEKKQRSLTANVARRIVERMDLTPDKLERVLRIYDEFGVLSN